jgi:hypothetical protein
MKISPRALLAVPILLAASALPVVVEDHESIPPAASEVHAMLAGGAGLAKAIEVAQQGVGGLAQSAAFEPDGSARVHVFSETSHFEVVVSGGAVTEKKEVPRFPGEPVQGQWTETASGLKYYEIKVGDGPAPAGPSTKVKVHYSGWLTNGTKFDSSVDRGQPTTFGLNQVIRGWTEGVGSMKVGGKRKLIIPFDLAYGASGRPPVIPARATLVFDVELLEIVQ